MSSSDEAPELRAKRLNLPPRRPPKELHLPPRRDDRFLPDMEGKPVSCPYCKASFIWPPEGLKCPQCKSQIRPPHGFHPKNAEERRALREQIVKRRDAALKQLGHRASVPSGPLGIGVVLMILVVVGAMVVSASKVKRDKRAPDNPYVQTTNWMAIYATALEHFKTDVGRYPRDDENGLLSLQRNVANSPDWNGPYIASRGRFRDGWNTPFVYHQPGTNSWPVLYSMGEDKQPGTDDDLIAGPELFVCDPRFKPRDPNAASKISDNPITVKLGGGSR